ncbi:MAG: hypothetical protein CW691_04315 [Candidatus Bathyarchaeum sp.]|nr:MAG: hypothetical protein CW691_04315 [Candidatus Bathyarchaeum sp.]
MFLGKKRKLKVDLGELKAESEYLSSFLSSKLKVDVSSMGKKLYVYSDSLSPSELKRIVTKFVYHNHLNHTYWVALEGNGVKIHKFKHAKKKGKQKNAIIPSTIKHGW